MGWEAPGRYPSQAHRVQVETGKEPRDMMGFKSSRTYLSGLGSCRMVTVCPTDKHKMEKDKVEARALWRMALTVTPSPRRTGTI
jgi:hypothetical protein